MGRNSAVVVMQRSQLMADSRAAIQEMCPALRQKCKQLLVDIVQHHQQTILFLHSLGRTALDVKESPNEYLTQKQRDQGVDPLDLIRRAASAGNGYETLKKAMQFASVYNDDDLKRLLGYRSKTSEDFRLLWGHAIYLMSVEDTTARIRFEREAVSNLWMPQELRAAIVKFYNGPRGGGGRNMAIPKTVPKQLEQIQVISQTWVKRHMNVWNGKNHSVYTNVMQQSDDALSGETLASLNSVAATLEDMQAAINDELQACKRTQQYVQSVLDVRAGGSTGEPAKEPTKAPAKAKEPVKAAKGSGKPTAAAATRAATRAAAAAKGKTVSAG